jgi:hypothetical protein
MTSLMGRLPTRHDRGQSIGELMSEMTSEIQTLFQQEVELAKAQWP